MNLLVLHLENDFGEDLRLIANNEVDLENHLNTLGFTDVRFSDLRAHYGTCQMKDTYDSYTAKCIYCKKV
jgi:hypothetical protein